jgi:hypothetical protein
MTKEVVLVSKARVPLTKNRITQDALKLAATVTLGSILGVECASEQEPYVVLKAVSALYEYLGEDEYTWMGWVRSGDWVIDTVKFEKCGGSDEFWVVKEEKRFPIFQEDLRTIITGYQIIEVRQSTRKVAAPQPMRMEVASAEIRDLEERAVVVLSTKPKERERERKKPKSCKKKQNVTK